MSFLDGNSCWNWIICESSLSSMVSRCARLGLGKRFGCGELISVDLPIVWSQFLWGLGHTVYCFSFVQNLAFLVAGSCSSNHGYWTRFKSEMGFWGRHVAIIHSSHLVCIMMCVMHLSDTPAGNIREAVCRARSRRVELRCDSICTTVWESTIWWWEYSQLVWED
jgi:hypothetical protein